ncbi:MAG: hypothetical protein ACD_21C00072G0023 [uncultured bacterium]|nr:MAG: hypothetical protein ACD_21C00072G0023 [uncultured bacterium]
MNQLLTKYQQTIDKLPLEARAIILAVALGFIFIIWYYGFWKSLQADVSKTNNSIKELELAIPLLKEQVFFTEKNLKDNQEQAAKSKTEKNTPQTKDASLQLISPQKINEVLQDLLTARSHLVLLQLQNLPPKTAILPQTNLKVFEHGIIVKFQGNYFSTMNYLQAIEKLGWRIFWDKLEYKVIQYPIAEITLQIHTLSDQGDWIDV